MQHMPNSNEYFSWMNTAALAWCDFVWRQWIISIYLSFAKQIGVCISNSCEIACVCAMHNFEFIYLQYLYMYAEMIIVDDRSEFFFCVCSERCWCCCRLQFVCFQLWVHLAFPPTIPPFPTPIQMNKSNTVRFPTKSIPCRRKLMICGCLGS